MKTNPLSNRANPSRARPRSPKSLSNTIIQTLTQLDSRYRIGLSIMFGMAVFLLFPDSMHLDSRVLASWIAGNAFFLTIVFLMMSRADPQTTYSRAQRQEAQHWTIFLLVVCTALTSIFAIALMLADNKDVPPAVTTIQIILSVGAILSSWFLTHTMFALHYTSCYYREDYANPETDYAGGITLPDEGQPDFLDFLYFSFTIGMTSQTSDISINAAPMRRLALGHGLVSFFFYSVIIALSVGVVGGLL